MTIKSPARVYKERLYFYTQDIRIQSEYEYTEEEILFPVKKIRFDFTQAKNVNILVWQKIKKVLTLKNEKSK